MMTWRKGLLMMPNKYRHAWNKNVGLKGQFSYQPITNQSVVIDSRGCISAACQDTIIVHITGNFRYNSPIQVSNHVTHLLLNTWSNQSVSIFSLLNNQAKGERRNNGRMWGALLMIDCCLPPGFESQYCCNFPS